MVLRVASFIELCFYLYTAVAHRGFHHPEVSSQLLASQKDYIPNFLFNVAHKLATPMPTFESYTNNHHSPIIHRINDQLRRTFNRIANNRTNGISPIDKNNNLSNGRSKNRFRLFKDGLLKTFRSRTRRSIFNPLPQGIKTNIDRKPPINLNVGWRDISHTKTRSRTPSLSSIGNDFVQQPVSVFWDNSTGSDIFDNRQHINIIDRRTKPRELISSILSSRELPKSLYKDNVFSPFQPVHQQSSLENVRNPRLTSKSIPVTKRLISKPKIAQNLFVNSYRQSPTISPNKNTVTVGFRKSNFRDTGFSAASFGAASEKKVKQPTHHGRFSNNILRQTSTLNSLHSIQKDPTSVEQRPEKSTQQTIADHNTQASQEMIYAIPRDVTEQKLLLMLLLRRFGLIAIPLKQLRKQTDVTTTATSTTSQETRLSGQSLEKMLRARAPLNFLNFIGLPDYALNAQMLSPTITTTAPQPTTIVMPSTTPTPTLSPSQLTAIQTSIHEQPCGRDRNSTFYHTPGLERYPQQQVRGMFAMYAVCVCQMCQDCETRPINSVSPSDVECGSKRGSKYCCCCEGQ